MIQLKTIHIEEFRGIKSLHLDIGGGNFGICGPNGTGKSGVVDAIEFCLTGNVTRLSGQGQGELSVSKHAPHVDSRNHPEKAKVEITARIPSLNKDVTISRSVKAPTQVSITPSGSPEQQIIENLEAHPEFALSRREIAKYIITPPAQRSADVQNLLRLDYIGDLRKALNTYNNRCKKDADDAVRAKSRAEQELKTALGLDTLKRELVLESANLHRKALGLPELTELAPDTSFKGGATKKDDGGKKPTVAKAVALADLKMVAEVTAKNEPEELVEHRAKALTSLKALKDDSEALKLARQHGFLKTGLEFVTDDTCPLCDTEWQADELRTHLKTKLLSSEETGKTLEALQAELTAIDNALEERLSDIAKPLTYGKALDPAIPGGAFDIYIMGLEEARASIKQFCDDHTSIDPTIAAVEAKWWSLPEEVQTRLGETLKAVEALPDLSAKDSAIDFLAVLQDRYERLIAASKDMKALAARSSVTQKVYDHYNAVSNSVLEGIYDAVAEEFTELYKAINDDEGKFIGELKVEPAKLSFNVDFYGRGTFPPGAYHSEGHQDGMGLCLYLALMRHTLGNDFTFAVLDDVLMSVDTGHRREVCRMLKTRFPNTQFLLTTHDRVWLQYMKTEKLIDRSQVFGGWTVEMGPRIWDDHDIWTEIHDQLAKNDVPRAAWLLRRYLEYISTVLADNLRASVEFRGDGSYDLGDLLLPVLSRWKDRLEKGIKTANHWGNDADKETLSEKLKEAKSLIAATNVEQWMINKSVHFNEWENFTEAEFKEVVSAYKTLLDHMRCPNGKCGSFPYLTPRKGSSEQLRCNCQAININLKSN